MADLSSENDEYESDNSGWGEEDRTASQILGDTASHQLSAAKTAEGRTAASGAQWFSYKPATFPPSLNKFAETFTEDWAAGRNAPTRHHGGRSKKNLLRWFQAWMERIQDTVTTKDGGTFFVSKNNNDQGRHHRWLGHLKAFMFRTKGPKRDDHETVEEYQALLRELEVIRDEVVGWTAHFILYTATSTDTRAHVCATLTEDLVEKELPTTIAKAGDWRPFVEAFLADAGPEPNHQDLTAPVQQFAWTVHQNRNMQDITSALFAEMRRSASALDLRLSDINFEVVWQGGPSRRTKGAATTSSSTGGGAAARGGGDDDDEDVGVPVYPESFSRGDVDHIIEQTRAQTIAHIVFGQHLGCTFDARFRRELQQCGIGLRPDGTISYEEPLPRSDPLRSTRALALDNLVRLQCNAFCEKQSRKKLLKARPQLRGLHRESAPAPALRVEAASVAAPTPAPGTRGGEGHAGAVPVALVTQARPPPKRPRGEFCHACDLDANGHRRGTRAGHNTGTCPYLTECRKCGKKHTAAFNCERQKRKGPSGDGGSGSHRDGGGSGGSGDRGGGGNHRIGDGGSGSGGGSDSHGSVVVRRSGKASGGFDRGKVKPK
jgi:hypothetical protein